MLLTESLLHHSPQPDILASMTTEFNRAMRRSSTWGSTCVLCTV
jgi:hypothetical protein